MRMPRRMRRAPPALVAAAGALLAAGLAFAQTAPEPVGEMRFGAKTGDPAYQLPPGQRLISAFGERPVFSPDGKRIAFIGKSYGDAYEYDLATGKLRNLTSHAPHEGFLRVQYLGDGSLLLLGPRTLGKTRTETRMTSIELFWLDAAATRAPAPLKLKAWEGVATSRETNLIAWAEGRMEPGMALPTATTLKTGVVEVADGAATVTNVREVPIKADCVAEPQDFLPGDKGLAFPCYDFNRSDGRPGTLVLSVDLATKQIKVYPTPANLYGELEGLFPDGRRAFVECTPDRTTSMELCILELRTDNPKYLRLTHIMDYGQWKYGNPVVSPDGLTAAAQIGPAAVEAGVGQGIVLIDLPPS